MVITYDVATNIITVTGYTEATPCNFTDIYNADKAGTLSLHARTGITAVDGAAVAVNRAERPADYVVLGGASNDLYITIANWVGTTATIRITGTDRAGNALTEDIVVTANGTYYTTKLFKTITHTQVTVFTATGFDYDLTQGQWGVVWNQSDRQFFIGSHLQIGNGSTNTWFADTKKEIIISAGTNANTKCQVKINATFRLGQKDANGNVYDGCKFTLLYADLTEPFGIESGACGDVLFYNSYIECFTHNAYSFWRMYRDSSQLVEIIGCTFGYFKGGLRIQGTNSKLLDTSFTNSETNVSPITFKAPFGEINNLRVTKSYQPLYWHSASIWSGAATIKNLYARDNSVGIKVVTDSSLLELKLIDTDIDAWTFVYGGTYQNKIYRQNTFNLKVIDKDNTPIQTATVKIRDKDSNLIVDTTTDANGDIATQTISRGYYNQANGNTLQEYSPHLIKIEKAGYTTYEADFTLGAKIDWTIALQGVLKRNPGMTGGMV